MRTRRPLRLGACERGTRSSRPALFLREAPQASVLLIKAGGTERQVIVHPRYVRLLVLLIDAWNEDEEQPDAVRGFRTGSEIARAFGRFLDGRGSIDVATVVQYVYEIRLLLNPVLASSETAFDVEPIELFEHRRNLGYRIGPRGLMVRGTAGRPRDPA